MPSPKPDTARLLARLSCWRSSPMAARRGRRATMGNRDRGSERRELHGPIPGRNNPVASRLRVVVLKRLRAHRRSVQSYSRRSVAHGGGLAGREIRPGEPRPTAYSGRKQAWPVALVVRRHRGTAAQVCNEPDLGNSGRHRARWPWNDARAKEGEIRRRGLTVEALVHRSPPCGAQRQRDDGVYMQDLCGITRDLGPDRFDQLADRRSGG